MRHKSLTVFFLFITTLTFVLGCWQLYRLEWKNNLIQNINSSIVTPNFYSPDIVDYNELTAVKLDNDYTAIDQPIFIESKTNQNKVGYHAVTPLFLNDKIYSFLRLRINNKNYNNCFSKEYDNKARIRELHVYGRVNDIYSKNSIVILYIISLFFEKIYIIKPLTSRPANSEKYILCSKYKDFNESNIYLQIFKKIIENKDLNYLNSDVINVENNFIKKNYRL